MKTTRCFINGVEAPCPSSVLVMNPRGSEFWKELHEWAMAADPLEWDANVTWFLGWEKRVFSVFGRGCPCFQHWGMIKVKHPVEWDNLFSWSVKAHNEVNAILGKPIFNLEEATRVFSSFSDSFAVS
jgi:hypothetical protein